MNNFLIVDFENNDILFLNKIKMNFKENEKYTSSISCIDKEDLIEELKQIIKDLEEEIKEK